MADRTDQHRVAKTRAITEALQIFGKLWPRKFGPATAEADLGMWQDACDRAATEFIVPAARQLVASARSGSYPPKPADLCDVAQQLERRARPAVTETVIDRARDVLADARPFWYRKPGEPKGYGRLDAEHAIGFAIRSGGSLNVSDREIDQMFDGSLPWGWLAPADVPPFAAPEAFHAHWSGRRGEDAA